MNLRPDIPLSTPDAPPAAALCASRLQSDELHGYRTVAGERVGASYIWLAYSAFFWIEPFFHHKADYWALCVAVYLVFLALYVAYVRVGTVNARIAIIACFFLLGLATITFNQGGACFFVYVAAMLPFSVESVPVCVSVMAGEILSMAIYGFVRYHTRHYISIDAIIVGFFIPIAGASNIYVAQGKRADGKLRDAQAENVALAAVAERERIARDLHDVLGHTLSVIVLKAELAGRLMERDPERAALEIADVERTARTALADVREAIGGFRLRGLSAEIDQARQTLSSAGVTLTADTRPPLLSAQAETVLALAVREAVTNILRHAEATTCTLRFSVTPAGDTCMELADNGRGAAKTSSALGTSDGLVLEGNGLRGMRERVHALGGRFRITSDHGTQLHLELPCSAALPRSTELQPSPQPEAFPLRESIPLQESIPLRESLPLQESLGAVPLHLPVHPLGGRL